MSDLRIDLDTEMVHDRESFLDFVDALARHRRASVAVEQSSPSNPYGPQAGGWETLTIEDFLDAALRWAEDAAARHDPDFPPEPSWQAFASFLFCGKIYE